MNTEDRIDKIENNQSNWTDSEHRTYCTIRDELIQAGMFPVEACNMADLAVRPIVDFRVKTGQLCSKVACLVMKGFSRNFRQTYAVFVNPNNWMELLTLEECDQLNEESMSIANGDSVRNLEIWKKLFETGKAAVSAKNRRIQRTGRF